MRMDDRAMSELMGYTVLVAVVSIAAIGLLAGSMSAVSSAEKNMELSGSASSLRSFADMAASAVESNNTFYAACEVGLPAGYELIVLDKHDDFRSLCVYSGPGQLTFLPLGSVAIRSPFRSASFEGGAVPVNDSGDTAMELAPAIHVLDLGQGKKALYVSATSVSCDSAVLRGSPVVLYVRCSSVKPMAWSLADGSAVTLRVRSDSPDAWRAWLESCGFAVEYEGGEVKATMEGVSYVYVVDAEVDVRVESQ